MAKINIHAGHNPSGKIACGASDFLDESNQARKIKRMVIKYLKKKGHKVYDCTCKNGKSQIDVLKRIVAKCNKHEVDLDVSIHLNAGRRDKKGDGDTGGCEVLVTKNIGSKGKVAQNVCKEISQLGYHNRGVEETSHLYVLNQTKAPAILVECCFVDDKDDYLLYKKGNYKEMAKAIAFGIDKEFSE